MPINGPPSKGSRIVVSRFKGYVRIKRLPSQVRPGRSALGQGSLGRRGRTGDGEPR